MADDVALAAASSRLTWHGAQTAAEVPHAHSIEILPLTKPTGHFQWAFRRSGKLIERSDRPHRSKAKARECAMEAVKRAMKPDALLSALLSTQTLGRDRQACRAAVLRPP